MKFRKNTEYEVIASYLQFVNTLECLGMFFPSAALIRRPRRYTTTVIEGISNTTSFFCLPFKVCAYTIDLKYLKVLTLDGL